MSDLDAIRARHVLTDMGCRCRQAGCDTATVLAALDEAAVVLAGYLDALGKSQERERLLRLFQAGVVPGAVIRSPATTPEAT